MAEEKLIPHEVKVLIVDDQYPNLLALEALLEMPDRTIHCAQSAKEALNLLANNEYALILSDIQMPIMDGYEFAAKLKTIKSAKNTPVIFVTAHNSDLKDVYKGYDEGAIDYLLKPLNPHIVKAKVSSFIQMYKQQKQIQSYNKLLNIKMSLLKQSNEALEDFARIVAHDLKAPLRTISSFLQLLYIRNKEILDSESIEFIDICSNSAKRLNDLIKGLMTFAKTGENQTENTCFNFNEVIKTVKINLLGKLKENNAEIIVDGEMPEVEANKMLSTQLMQNLIENGIKYQLAGNKPIIKISSRENDDNEWVFSVQDNGIGIDIENKDHVFAIFKRLHKDEKYSGTGIGLSICKKIVERSGGKIWFVSTPNKGTTFYFTLPKSRKLKHQQAIAS